MVQWGCAAAIRRRSGARGGCTCPMSPFGIALRLRAASATEMGELVRSVRDDAVSPAAAAHTPARPVTGNARTAALGGWCPSLHHCGGRARSSGLCAFRSGCRDHPFPRRRENDIILAAIVAADRGRAAAPADRAARRGCVGAWAKFMSFLRIPNARTALLHLRADGPANAPKTTRFYVTVSAKNDLKQHFITHG